MNDLPDPVQTRRLLRQAQAGDSDALADLVARHQVRLLRIVRVYLGPDLRSHLESMDLVQAANQVVIREIGRLETEDPNVLLRWLTKIVVNQIRAAHDHLHAQRRDVDREQPLNQNAGTVSSAHTGQDLEADQTTPPDRAARNEVRSILDQAVSSLPREHRQVIVLRDYCNCEWVEIAEQLQRSEGAVRMLHKRAWESLRGDLLPRLGRDSDRVE